MRLYRRSSTINVSKNQCRQTGTWLSPRWTTLRERRTVSVPLISLSRNEIKTIVVINKNHTLTLTPRENDDFRPKSVYWVDGSKALQTNDWMWRKTRCDCRSSIWRSKISFSYSPNPSLTFPPNIQRIDVMLWIENLFSLSRRECFVPHTFEFTNPKSHVIYFSMLFVASSPRRSSSINFELLLSLPTGSAAAFNRVLLIWSTLLTRRSTWRMGRQRKKILVLCSLKRERRTRRDSSSSTTRGGNSCKWLFRSVGEWRSVCTLDQSDRNSSQWNDESILSERFSHWFEHLEEIIVAPSDVMSTTIVEHRHIERSIGRKRWRCREKLSSDRLRSAGRWGVVSLRARPSEQSLWYYPGSNCHGDDRHTSIDRWSDALSSQRHRINFGSKAKKRQWMNGKENNLPVGLSSDIGRRQIPEHCSSWEDSTDGHFSVQNSIQEKQRERNRWWFPFWAKREKWSHLTACRRSKRDKQLKKRSVIGTFAHGGSMGGEGLDRHVASEGWWRWRDFRRVTGSTGDRAVGGEMNRIVVENDQWSTRVLLLARGMSDQ